MTSHQWHGERDLERKVSSQSHETHPESKGIFQQDTLKMSNNLHHEGSKVHPSENLDPETYVKDSENEVDYYNNPTELFRWINYRKWGGAWARVQTNPEECSTWVVSRHSADGRILWRHLPLHLVCMQSCIPVATDNSSSKDESRDAVESMHPNILDTDASNQRRSTQFRQLERLAEEILFTYPSAAKAQDDQGLIPLQSCINSASSATCINERIYMMLLIVNPAGLQSRNRNGQTALEMLMERRAIIPGIESIIRITNNAISMVNSIANSFSGDAEKELLVLRQRYENERQASQRIIARLEDEIAKDNERANDEEGIKIQCNTMQVELNRLKKNYESLELDLDQVRRERDELIVTNKNLTEQVDNQEEVVAEIKRQAEMECAEQERTIANLKSEANTFKAMVEAVENQLRNKFTNEQDLNSSVNMLEKKVATLTSAYQKDKKDLHNEIDRIQEEKSMSGLTIEELNKKIDSLQVRNNSLSKNIEDVLFSHSALAAEYDKLLDSSKRYESRVLESFQIERENLLSSIDKQKKMFDVVMEEKKQMINDARQKEVELTELINSERKTQHESILKIREDYQKIRTHISNNQIDITKRPTPIPRSRAPSPGGLGNERIFLDKSNTFNAKQRINSKSTSLHQRSTKNKERQSMQHHRRTSFQDDESQQSTERSSIQSFKGLMGYLDEKSRQHRHSPGSSSYGSSQSPNRHSPMGHTKPTSAMLNKPMGIYTPTRSQEISRSMEVNPSDFTPKKSFSLDEFSDMDSRHSSCADSTAHDYSGMASAIKKGVIRINPKPSDSIPPSNIYRGVRNRFSHNNGMASHQIQGSLSSVQENDYVPQPMERLREKYSKKQSRSKYSVMDDEGGSVNTEDYGFSVSSSSDIMPLGNL